VYDLHNHILPQVDDGAKGMRMSIRMLEHAIRQGITHVLATPHVNERTGAQAALLFDERLTELRAEVQRIGLPIEIGLGSEVMFGAGMNELFNFSFSTLNGTGKYYLVEFPRQTPFEIILNVIKASRKWKKIPVVAHHERYPLAFRSVDQLIMLRREGAILTLDAGSLTGQFGKPMMKHARDLVSTGHIEVLMSDAHDDDQQNFCLAAGRDAAAAIVGAASASKMVTEAPRRIWDGDDWPLFEN